MTELISLKFSEKAHGDIESFIQQEGTVLLKTVLQDYLNIRATKETRHQAVYFHEHELNHVSPTSRKMESLFGSVTVNRLGYSQRKQASQFPLDKALNLPQDKYSDGLRRYFVYNAIKSSFDESVISTDRHTGGHIPKRQASNLIHDVAQDFEAFYRQKRFNEPEKTQDLLVLSFDAKGIVMRHDSLRTATKKAAEVKSHKLQTRLSQGEKRHRKRMAQVATVYTVTPCTRTAESIMNKKKDNVTYLRPKIKNKRVWASVERDAETVIMEAFQEALQRDPMQCRQWVILVDGHPHQIRLIKRIMKQLKIKAFILQDFIHVLEYIWAAAWCLFEKGSEEAQTWVSERALKVLNGQAGFVAAGIKRSATKRKMTEKERQAMDNCASYLLKSKSRLYYNKALQSGYPIATGVIEGACRHLINDRLDITGARWCLQGAEAILKLRSIYSSGDFDAYWLFHKEKSAERIYQHLTLKI
ncbi:ISKra4 family transposase [bacterium]|nr:ISKra4 family transposase [bacterium]